MSYPLEHVYDEAAPYANFLIEMIGAAPSVETIGKMCNDLAAHYRTLGLCELLIEADTDLFFHYLIDSAQTRKYYLDRCRRDHHLADPERRTSINGPFLDAVVAGQYDLAATIAALSASDWMEGYEYEEDFAYTQWLHAMVATPEDTSALTIRLSGYETALQGNPDARLDVGKALIARDADAFHFAFLALLNQFGDEVQLAKQHAYRFDDHQLVFIEGLALLRLADRAGIPVRQVYRYCPAPARLSEYRTYRPRSFPNLPL